MNTPNDLHVVEQPEGDARGSSPARCYASGRDWTEDAPNENGNYQNRCCQCEQMFTGHKRRVVCKVCDEANRVAWAAMSDEEKAAIRQQRESEFIHWMMGQRHNVEVSGCLRVPMPEDATRTAAGSPLDRPVGPVAGA